MGLSIYFFDRAFDTPEENLACDEALLEFAEENDPSGFLRFFESTRYFVVLGYGKKILDEVIEEVCEEFGISILRRCSGGGTVVQGPGCFNYSLVLPIDSIPGLDTITGANRTIMARNRDALSSLLKTRVDVEGVTDLTIEGVKFSGNAQRRKKKYLLFHGSFLLRFDLSLVTRLLRIPGQQPQYRANRDHGSFIRNVELPNETLVETLRETWSAKQNTGADLSRKIQELTDALVATKYSRDEWNRRS